MAGLTHSFIAFQFRQVVHAFEILSDEKSRRYYDRTGRSDGGSFSSGGGRGGGSGGQYQHTWTWNWNARPMRLKDKFEVKRAQSRILHVVSLEQLKTIMLDDNERLERNLLISFVTPGKIETHVQDEMVFPYPFAGMSSQRIWWEDVIQTVQIRFHRSSELSRFFGIPDAEALTEPVFLFGRRGEPLSDAFARLSTMNRNTFETWVWKQIEIEVEFVNDHPHPVEVYWIHHSRATLKMTLDPGESNNLITMLSHEWWVRDARTDTRPDSPGRYKLTDNTCLANWKILNDTNPQRFVIQPKACYDLSGHCTFWWSQMECTKNPNFKAEQCQKTCNF